MHAARRVDELAALFRVPSAESASQPSVCRLTPPGAAWSSVVRVEDTTRTANSSQLTFFTPDTVVPGPIFLLLGAHRDEADHAYQ